MDAEKLNQALYDKMAAEQDTFRTGLLKMPPEEILNHTYEYTVREDILMKMEDMELPARQAEILLKSPSPLADIYRDFSKLETGHMDMVQECIENRAEAMLEKQQEEHRATPLYQESLGYAREHGEMEQWQTSHQQNMACRDAIDREIRENYDGMHLTANVKDVLEEFGQDRVTLVLAATLQARDGDERFSRSNQQWAAAVPMFDGEIRRFDYALNSHSVLLDGFVDMVRKEQDIVREQPAKKPSIKAQLAAKSVPGDQTAKPKGREER